MQVTDEMVERAIKAYHDTQNGLQWFMRGNNFKETMRAALTAALSDKQAGEVKIKPLEWNRRNSDGTIHIATALPGEYWAWELAGYGYWSWGSLSGREVPGGLDAAKAAAQADYEQRIRSALVDVPAVEPVAWLDDGLCRAGSDRTAHRVVTSDQKRDMPAAIASSFTPPLYTSPPLSHRGEDSAEVIEELLRHLDRMQSNAIRAGELAWHPNSPIAESIEKVRVLAATPSGSAIKPKGTDQ